MIDITKPRYRRDYGLTTKLVNKKFFTFFKKKHKNTGIKDFNKMREVLKEFHGEVTDIIANERTGFDLLKLAEIFVVGYFLKEDSILQKQRYVNYKLTDQVNKRITYTNMDTDGKICKIFFSLKFNKYGFPFRSCWGFTPARSFKAKVSKSFKSNHTRFLTFHKNVPRKLASNILR